MRLNILLGSSKEATGDVGPVVVIYLLAVLYLENRWTRPSFPILGLDKLLARWYYGLYMEGVNFNLNSLRGWQRKQLELLRVFADNIVVPQTMISLTSGASQSSSALGGKITPLIRHNLILRAGKDSNGKIVWQLNEETVDRETLRNFLTSLDIRTHGDTESV